MSTETVSLYELVEKAKEYKASLSGQKLNSKLKGLIHNLTVEQITESLAIVPSEEGHKYRSGARETYVFAPINVKVWKTIPHREYRVAIRVDEKEHTMQRPHMETDCRGIICHRVVAVDDEVMDPLWERIIGE